MSKPSPLERKPVPCTNLSILLGFEAGKRDAYLEVVELVRALGARSSSVETKDEFKKLEGVLLSRAAE